MSERQPEATVECDGCAGNGSTRLDRATVLSRLEVGDILCARSPKTPLIICLVKDVTPESIVTRRVTDGEAYIFNRRTGLEKTGSIQIEVISVEPLPADIHDIMIRIERRNRLQVDRTHFRLDENERRALSMLDKYYYSKQIDEMIGGPH